MRTLFLALWIALPAVACSCISTATPCSLLGGTSVIFVADVVVDSGEGIGKGPAKVAIVEPLQNVPAGLKEATIETAAGTSCYFRLRAGERYVIITSGPRYSVQACNSSFRVAGNEHILDAMRSYFKGGPQRLVGSVQKSTGRYSHEGGIPNVSVDLRTGESRFTTTTDGDGHYVLIGLEPGRYKIQVSKEGYLPDDEYNHRWSGRLAVNPDTKALEPVKDVPGEIVISGSSCEIRDLALWPAGSIRGTVRGLDGKPLKDVSVQAFGVDRHGERESAPLRTATTDPDGRYSIQPLPSGQYVIGVNASPYHDENPYPPFLYENGRSVYLKEVDSINAIDLVVSAPRTSAWLRIRAVGPDGKPYKGATVRLDTRSGVQRWFSREKTDGSGELLAPVYLGESYTVRVFNYLVNAESGRILHLEGSMPVEIASRESAITVALKVER